MKRIFTAAVWAGAMLTLACVNVPTVAGQEMAAVKAGMAVEKASTQEAQLRIGTV